MNKFLLFLILALFAAGLPARAQQSLEFSGLAITPFLIEADLESGAVSDQKIILTNTTDKTISYDISINDFIRDEKNGPVRFLPTGENAEPKYSLSSWINVTAQPNFNLKAGESSEIKFRISVPKDAELGTHYGGILFSPRGSQNSGSGPVVVEKVGAIVLVKVGHAREQGNIANFYVEETGGRDKNFILEFHNFGNVHLKPKGEIFIHNMLGRRSGNLYLNRDADIVLPETQKDFTASWRPSSWAFGRYTATAVLYYGNPKIEVRSTVSFWILPIIQLLIFILILVGLFFAGRFSLRRYNNRIIRGMKR